MSKLHFNIITLFSDILLDNLKYGVVGQAYQTQKFTLETVSPRDFTKDRHQTVDDRPFGGGDSMVMLYEPLKKSLESLGDKKGHVVFLSAQGRRWSDAQAREWAQNKPNITLICGRYAGVDQRFINECVDEEISIGDYVLSGGELAAMVLIDSITRFLPEVLGNADSAQFDSFADGLLEPPLFTRPQNLTASPLNMVSPQTAVPAQTVEQAQTIVPRVFLSGDHERIRNARRVLSLLVTAQKRPDLLTELHKKELLKSKSILKEFSYEELQVCGLSRALIQGYYE